MNTRTTISIRRSILAVGILGTLGVMTTSSHAAVVTWGAAQNITGDSDVSAAGSLVGAFNVGSTSPAPVSSTLVNTVLFQSFAVPNNGGGSVTVGNFTLAPIGGGALISDNTAGGVAWLRSPFSRRTIGRRQSRRGTEKTSIDNRTAGVQLPRPFFQGE